MLNEHSFYLYRWKFIENLHISPVSLRIVLKIFTFQFASEDAVKPWYFCYETFRLHDSMHGYWAFVLYPYLFFLRSVIYTNPNALIVQWIRMQ